MDNLTVSSIIPFEEPGSSQSSLNNGEFPFSLLKTHNTHFFCCSSSVEHPISLEIAFRFTSALKFFISRYFLKHRGHPNCWIASTTISSSFFLINDFAQDFIDDLQILLLTSITVGRSVLAVVFALITGTYSFESTLF